MKNFEDMNKTFDTPFTFPTDDLEWTSLEALYTEDKGRVYTVRGLFINEKAKFGAAPAVVTEFGIAYLPKNELDNVTDILAEQESIDAINAGKMGIKIRKYHSNTYNKDCYAVKYINL